MDYNLFQLASEKSTQAETPQDVANLYTSSGVFMAAAKYAVATNLSNYAIMYGSELFDDRELSVEQLDKIGIKSSGPMTVTRANFRLNAMNYDKTFEKALYSSNYGSIKAFTVSVGGALAGAVFDPAAIILSLGVASGIAKTLRPLKSVQEIMQKSFAYRTAFKAGAFGVPEAAINLSHGKLIANTLEQPYKPVEIFADAAFGFILGTVGSPKLKLSKTGKERADLHIKTTEIKKQITEKQEQIEMLEKGIDIEPDGLIGPSTDIGPTNVNVGRKIKPVSDKYRIKLKKEPQVDVGPKIEPIPEIEFAEPSLTKMKVLDSVDIKPANLIETLVHNQPLSGRKLNFEGFKAALENDNLFADMLRGHFGIDRSIIIDKGKLTDVGQDYLTQFREIPDKSIQDLFTFSQFQEGAKIFELYTENLAFSYDTDEVFNMVLSAFRGQDNVSTEEFLSVFKSMTDAFIGKDLNKEGTFYADQFNAFLKDLEKYNGKLPENIKQGLADQTEELKKQLADEPIPSQDKIKQVIEKKARRRTSN